MFQENCLGKIRKILSVLLSSAEFAQRVVYLRINVPIFFMHYTLTLKTPGKPASENVVCLYHLLNILTNFSNLILHTGKRCGP